MSASKEKRVRTEQRSEGIYKKTNAEIEASKKHKRFKRNAIIAVIIIALVIAGAVFVNSNYLFNKAPAVQIGNTEFTSVELSYYYKSMYSNYCSQYGDYVSIFFDQTKPLSEQQYSETETWEDYFYGLAIQQMTQITALYDDAMAKGYTLDEDGQTTVENYIGYLQLVASTNNQTVDAFLALNYGNGMNLDLYRKIITKSTIATNYAQSLTNSYEYTSDELKAYYADNAADLDIFTFNSYYIPLSSDAYAELDDEAKKTAVHDAAAAIAEASSLEEFAKNIQDFVGEEDKADYEDVTATQSNTQGSQVSSYYKEWLTDSARVPFETTVVDSDYGSYAVMYVSRDNNEYSTAIARHILFEAEADAEGNYTDEALQAAKEEAESVYETWKTNPTEENFITLAKENSDDPAVSQNEGLYEDIYKGKMVDEFDAFCFAEGVKPGDTAIVYGETSDYAGYHIVYYVGEGRLCCDYLADQHLRSEEYSDYLESLMDTYTVTTKFANRFADFSVN